MSVLLFTGLNCHGFEVLHVWPVLG